VKILLVDSLAYWPDSGRFRRFFLFLGFAIFCMGVPGGFNLKNRAMMIGVSLLAGGIAGHYWSTAKYDTLYVNDRPHGGAWKPGAVVLAMVFSAVCIAAGWLVLFHSN
jgi:hypothetical protein